MWESIFSFLSFVRTVGACVVVVFMIEGNFNSRIVEVISAHKEKIELQEQLIANLENEISEIKLVINPASKGGGVDVLAKIMEIDTQLYALEKKNSDVFSLLRDDPETMATVREINFKYNQVLKDLERIEKDFDRYEDKAFDSIFSNTNILWTIVITVLATFLQNFIPRKERRNEYARSEQVEHESSSSNHN